MNSNLLEMLKSSVSSMVSAGAIAKVSLAGTAEVLAVIAFSESMARGASESKERVFPVSSPK